jgi:hypothetical protein
MPLGIVNALRGYLQSRQPPPTQAAINAVRPMPGIRAGGVQLNGPVSSVLGSQPAPTNEAYGTGGGLNRRRNRRNRGRRGGVRGNRGRREMNSGGAKYMLGGGGNTRPEPKVNYQNAMARNRNRMRMF